MFQNKKLSITYICIAVVVLGLIFNDFSIVSAAFNQEINYQGKLTNTSDSAVSNGSYNMSFRLCTNSTCTAVGDPIWTENLCYSPDSGTTCDGTGTDQRISVSSGLFSVLLGSITSLSSINFNQTLWLEVRIGGSGSTPSWETLTPRKKLGASPGAFEAKQLGGYTWASPDSIGSTNSNTGVFTTLSAASSSASAILTVTQSGAGYGAIITGGNVGIGDTSPDGTLDIDSSATTGVNFGITNTGVYTGTGLLSVVADSATTGVVGLMTANGLSSGSILSLTSNGTAGLTDQKGLNIALSGTNGTSAQTTYGAYISNTHAGTTSTNVGLYATATGGTTANYAAVFASGNVGIGTATPSQELDLIGDLEMETTTSNNTGVIYKGSDRFIHNFKHPTGNTAIPEGYNTFVGVNAGNFTMGSTATLTIHGSYNTALGASSTPSNTTGYNNSALGAYSLYFNTIGYNNSAVGAYSLYSNPSNPTGVGNSALGAYSLYSNTGGAGNSAVGNYSLYSNTLGDVNAAVGSYSLYSNTIGYYNTAIGAYSLYSNGSSDSNTAIGDSSGYSLVSGDANVFLGHKAGYYETGSEKLYIENSSSTAPLIGGDFSADEIYLNGKVGIGITPPTSSFHLVQSVATTGSPTAFTVAGGAHTTLTASAEASDINFNLTRTVQFATGALATQRAIQISAPTYGFVGASTLTDASTLAISGAPVKGTNTTLTNTFALKIAAGAVSTAVNAFGLYVDAPTQATNNYAAVFASGNVGIGQVSPTAVLHLKAGTATASTAPLKFTSGVSLTTAEAGAMEFTTDDLYFTITTGAARKGIVLNDGTNLTSTRVPYATTNGRLTDSANLTFDGTSLTAAGLIGPLKVSSTTGVNLTATNGVLTIAGLKATGNNENLTFDFETTSNTVAIGTGTGVTTLNLNSIGITTTGALGAGAITGTSFIIGANTLDTNEWAYLDGQDQAVKTTSTPQFARLGLGIAADATDILTASSTSTTDLSKAINAVHTGVITTGTGTGYAGYFSKTGAATTNVGLYATASGAVTNNYAAIFEAGNVGIGDTSPQALLTVGTNDVFQVNSSGQVASGTWQGSVIDLTYGGTNKALAASNGGIVYTDADSMERLAGTATANQVLLSGASAAPAWSTATYPTTTTINQLLYSSSANVIAGLATANSGVLVTGGTGVPSIATDIPTAVTIGSAYIYRASGTDVALADGGTGASLTDPNADRIMFWDDSGGAVDWLAPGNSVAITTTTLDTIQDIRTTATPQFARLGLGIAAGVKDILTISTSAATSEAIAIVHSGSGASDGIGISFSGTGDNSKGIVVTHSGTAVSGSIYGGYFLMNGGASDGIQVNYGLYVKAAGTTTGAGSTTNYALYATASEGDNNYAAIFAAGNVGIGDTTPDYLLELYDPTNTPVFALSDDDVAHGVTTLTQTDVFGHFSSISTTVGGMQVTGLADATGIALGLKGVQSSDPTDTTPAVSIIGTKASGTGVQDLAAAETVLQVANNDDTAALTILGSGNVGIGTATPTRGKLQVAGALNATMTTNAFGTASVYTAFVMGDQSGTPANGGNGGLYAIARNTTSRAPFTALSGWDDGTRKDLYFGGGGWLVPDANWIGFYTEPVYTETADQGVLRMTINTNGHISMGSAGSSTMASTHGLNVMSHTVDLTGVNPTTYAYMYETNLGILTLQGVNANQTVTNVATLYVANPANAGTNVTITNKYPILTESAATLTTTGIWTNAPSFRRYKDNFTGTESYLDKLAQLDVFEWQYRNEIVDGVNRYEMDSTRHTSPFLDDFYTAFNLGDDKGVNVQDLAGVALASVKELNTRFEQFKNQMSSQIGPNGTLPVDPEQIAKVKIEIENDIKGLVLDNFNQMLKDGLEKLGFFIDNGIAQLKELVVEKLFAKTVRTERIEIVDKITESVYCSWLENGEWQKTIGECSSLEPKEEEKKPPEPEQPSEIVLPSEIEIQPEPEPVESETGEQSAETSEEITSDKGIESVQSEVESQVEKPPVQIEETIF